MSAVLAHPVPAPVAEPFPLPELRPPLRWDPAGAWKVGDTRIVLDVIADMLEDGKTTDEIAEGYPSLSLAEWHQVIGYYLLHREKFAPVLAERRRQADARRKAAEPADRAFWEMLRARAARRRAARESQTEQSASPRAGN